MSIAADKPGPFRVEANGKTVFIAFKWGKEEIPKAAVIYFIENETVCIADVLAPSWTSFKEAKTVAEAAADNWIKEQTSFE